MQWAVLQKVKGITAMVLIRLCEKHNHLSGRCDPSLSTLAEISGFSVDAVIRSLKVLQELELVTVEKRTRKKDGKVVNISNFYTLHLDRGEQPKRKEVVAHSDHLPAHSDHGSRSQQVGYSLTATTVVAHSDTKVGSERKERKKEQKTPTALRAVDEKDRALKGRPEKATDPRYREFIAELATYWKHANPGKRFDPAPADFTQIKNLLRNKPSLTPEAFGICLRHRYHSDEVVHSQDIHRWLSRVMDYADSPLNGYQKPKPIPKPKRIFVDMSPEYSAALWRRDFGSSLPGDEELLAPPKPAVVDLYDIPKGEQNGKRDGSRVTNQPGTKADTTSANAHAAFNAITRRTGTTG